MCARGKNKLLVGRIEAKCGKFRISFTHMGELGLLLSAEETRQFRKRTKLLSIRPLCLMRLFFQFLKKVFGGSARYEGGGEGKTCRGKNAMASRKRDSKDREGMA